MKGKNNIISEINRIHQIMGVKNQISEQVLASTGGALFRKLADELFQYGARKSLDRNSRSLISQLSRGTKQITDEAGKTINTPLNDDDYLNILARLRNSSDQGIRNIIGATDSLIIDIIEKQSIPKLLDDPDVIKKIQEAIQAGYNQDEVVDLIAPIINNRYGVYADEVIDVFIDGVRKVYDDLGGKVDNVIDDTGKVVDDVADESDLGTDNIDDMFDFGRVPSPDELDGALDDLADEPNNAREIATLSPLFNRYQNQTASQGVELANEAMELIERRAGLENLSGAELLNLETQIKDVMDRIFNWNKRYVEALEAEIDNQLQFRDSPNFERWEKIRNDVDNIKKKYGKWGVTEVTTSKSPTWIFVKETVGSAFRLYVDIYKLLKNATNIKQFGKDTIDYIFKSAEKAKTGIDTQAKKVADDFASDAEDKVSFISKYVFPGSPRGWPTKLKTEKGIDLPNAYGEIQKSAQSNQYLKAWLSLFLEKIIVVLRIQVEYAFLMGSYEFIKFLLTDKGVMQKFGPCVLETATKIKDGKIKLDDPNSFDQNNLPPCLLQLISSNQITEEELGQFMVRAEFFSRGSGSEITGYFTPYLFDTGKEDILRLFTGPIGNILIKGLDDWYDDFIEYEKTGDDYPLQTRLRNYRQSLETQVEENTEAANEAMENLTQSQQDSLVQVVDSIQNASGGTDFVINTDD